VALKALHPSSQPTPQPTSQPSSSPSVQPYVNIMKTVVGTGDSSSLGDGGLATAASIKFPTDITFDASGNYYIVEYSGCRVRKVTKSTGYISSVAGTGTCGYSGDGAQATIATLNNPNRIAVDSTGNIFIADQNNHRIRLVTASTGIITTIAGTGSVGFNGDGIAATSAFLAYPTSVALDTSGNIYIGDYNNNGVRMVTFATGIITTLVSVSAPEDLLVDPSGNIFITSPSVHKVYKYLLSSGALTLAAGTGKGSSTGELLRELLTLVSIIFLYIENNHVIVSSFEC
jgi:hypothetical protein